MDMEDAAAENERSGAPKEVCPSQGNMKPTTKEEE
jgi:hypothetical protein